MKIKIGNREIGDGYAPFIIAEVGSNWSSLDDCLKSISMAKACGADAVKFQLFDFEALYGQKAEWDGSDELYKALSKVSLPAEWLSKLKEKADAVGIEFMCTAFSVEGYELVDKYVNAHKVASAECTHKRILEKLRALGKPVFLSTGASGVKDIEMALECLRETPTVLMYCVAAYPARRIELTTLKLLNQLSPLVGYSDHSIDVGVIPWMAIANGACILEKHVNFVEATGPDAPHSINADDFKWMVAQIKAEGSIGGLRATAEEQPMVLRHNRRLIATRDIKAGDKFTENENFGIYRSLKDDTHAFHPFAVDHVNGKIAVRDIHAGDGIGPGDV